jgi:hypothetical protein
MSDLHVRPSNRPADCTTVLISIFNGQFIRFASADSQSIDFIRIARVFLVTCAPFLLKCLAHKRCEYSRGAGTETSKWRAKHAAAGGILHILVQGATFGKIE